MRCLNCSTPVPDDSRFCLSCGADLSDPSAGDQTSLTDDGVSNMERKLRADTAEEFEIERELGRGGMAVVYLATDVHLRRKVAIKVLPPDLTFGKGTIERFRREAQTAAQLDHPNIIPVYRISTGGDLFWYAMKYIEGRSLDEILKEGLRFDLGGCTDVLDQVAAALDWAHRRQVVHRDVKPANIMIDPTGRVTMADFGIAKALSKTSLTASGSAIGTPNYMSPEQCMGGEITGAADQYALGVVTYQMLSGKLPFEADSAVELIQKHCFVPPPSLEEARPGLPPRVYAAVERALAKKAAERFGSIGEFVGSLRDPARASVEGLASTPSSTPIPIVSPSATPIDAASTTPIPIDKQSTTPMPATPIPIDEASTTPIPTATPSATPVPKPAPAAAYEGVVTEVIEPVPQRRRVGVAALAIAALVVVAGGIGFMMMGGGAGEPAPPIAAQGDSGSDSLAGQAELTLLGSTPQAESGVTGAAGAGEELEGTQDAVQPPASDPTEIITEPQGARAEPTVARVDTPATSPPSTQERRTNPPAAAAVVPVVVEDAKPPAERKPPPDTDPAVTEQPTEREQPPAPATGPGTEAWSSAAAYRGLGSPAVGANGRIHVGLRVLSRAGGAAATLSARGTVHSAPALATDGTIYVGIGQSIHAFAPDGSQRWEAGVGARVIGSAIGGGRWIYVAADSGLYAFQPNGQQQWGLLMNLVTAPALGTDGTIYVGARDGLRAVGANGRQRWPRASPVGSSTLSSPALGAGGTVYVFSGDGKVYAFDRNGGQRWATAVALAARSPALSSPAIGRDGTLYVGTQDGHLHALNASNGNPKWLVQLGGRITASPVIADDGTIYVGSNTGLMYAVNSNGDVVWSLPVGSDPGSATIGPDGTVYVVTGDGMLHAIRSTSGGLADAPWPKAGHDNANSGYVGRD